MVENYAVLNKSDLGLNFDVLFNRNIWPSAFTWNLELDTFPCFWVEFEKNTWVMSLNILTIGSYLDEFYTYGLISPNSQGVKWLS